MPRYRSPSRSPSQSRSPSRTRASSTRGRSHSRGPSTYTDGVYTVSEEESVYSQSRSRSRSRSYSRSSPSRSPSPSRSLRTSSRKNPLAHAVDTSPSSNSSSHGGGGGGGGSGSGSGSGATKSEKAENMAKTSLVMLGAIGAATLAAHKFWPKGVTYGEREAWEREKDRAKDKMRDAKAAVTGEPRRDGRGGSGGGDGRRRRRHHRGGGGGGERDRSRERRTRYLEDRGLRDRDGRVRDGSDGRRLAPPTAAVAAAAGAAAAGGGVAAYHDGRRRGDKRGITRDHPRDGYDERDYDHPRGRRDRYIEAPAAPPAAPSAPPAAAIPPPQRVASLRHVEPCLPAAPTPPPVPNPPSVYREAATVVATGARDSERGGRRHYVDSDTVVIPSRAEIEYVVRRDAPPGNRLTVERDGRYYR